MRLVLIGLVGMIVGVVVAAYGLLRLSVPPDEGVLVTAGLRDTVEVTFDARGIPQIWANNEHDALFALGRQHAADRMFQMDLIRRVAQGRLSETLGSITIDLDRQQRAIGHGRIAAAYLDKLDPAVRDKIQAYVDGINSYRLTCRAMPFEFRLLPTDFEAWTVYDCLSILSFQTWFSNALMSRDEFARELTEKVGPERAAELLPIYPDDAPTSVPEETRLGNLDTPYPGRTAEQPMPSFSLIPTPWRMSEASNAWAVSPAKSVGGAAMLASDPHLEINRLPQFWYGAGLHIGDSVGVLGITVPGMPYFVMGHNGRAAWAFTVGGVDVVDYYAEQLNPDNVHQYLTPQGFVDFEIFVDTFAVANDDSPVIESTLVSCHGPVVFDSTNTNEVYTLHWAGYDVDLADAARAGFELSATASFDQFRHTVVRFGALDAAWIYADSSGNIGYQLGTPIPQRPSGANGLPLEGWLDDIAWSAYTLPPDQTPHVANPACGFLASCNNLSTRAIKIPGNYASDRIRRITALLSQSEQVSAEDMRRMQLDRTDLGLLKWSQRLADVMPFVDSAVLAKKVYNWNGVVDTSDQVAPLVLDFIDALKEKLYGDELGDLASEVPTALLDRQFNNYYDSISIIIAQGLNHRLQGASLVAAEKAREQYDGRTMGELQTLAMRHPMAVVPLIGSLLDLSHGPWPWPGSAGTLNASFSFDNPDGTYRVVVGPSWRFVIDFARIDSASFVLPAGNSGNPMSEHFFDFFEDWREGRTWTVPFSRPAVRARAVSVLTLTPTGD